MALYRYVGNKDKFDTTTKIRFLDLGIDVNLGETVELDPVQFDAIDDRFIFVPSTDPVSTTPIFDRVFVQRGTNNLYEEYGSAIVLPSGTESPAGVTRLEFEAELAARAADLSVTARVDEMPAHAVRLGALVGLERELVHTARTSELFGLARFRFGTSVPSGLSNRWQFILRRVCGPDHILSSDDVALAFEHGAVRLYKLDDNAEPSVPDINDDTEVVLADTLFALDSMGVQDGGYVNAPTQQVDGPPVGQQLATHFNGIDQHVVVPTDDLGITTGLTYATWVYLDADVLTDAGRMYLIGADNAAGTDRPSSFPALSVRPSQDGEPNGLSVWAGGGYIVQTSGFPGLRPGWNYVESALSFDGSQPHKLRANGVELIATYPTSTPLVNESVRLLLAKGSVANPLGNPLAGSMAFTTVFPNFQSADQHRERYGVIQWGGNDNNPIVAEKIWDARRLLIESNRVLMANDQVFFEATPLNDVVAIDSASVAVTSEVI